MNTRFIVLLGLTITLLPHEIAGRGSSNTPSTAGILTASAEAVLGARLFRETRFSQYYAVHTKGSVNVGLVSGDPVMNEVRTTSDRALPAVYPGAGMNCRQCHLGDDYLPAMPLAARTYCDFARRSPIPNRGDSYTKTVRNSPLTVDLNSFRETPELYHFDGEYASLEDLVIDTITGRNFGWLPAEALTAIAHAARVIREDDGRNALASYYSAGLPYRVVLEGEDSAIPAKLRVPRDYRISVSMATDAEILQVVAKLLRAYMNALRFGTNATGRQLGSPYDLFLEKNGLPVIPAAAEDNRSYADRLLSLVEGLVKPSWVTSADGSFRLHNQPYEFGPTELDGLRIFLREPHRGDETHAGSCVICHTPPAFTDRKFHNTGASQLEYDGLFGLGAFARLNIPTLQPRNANFNDYLPPSARHPTASGRFRSEPTAARPGYADLGVWNVVANPDMPKPQAALMTILCDQFGRSGTRCDRDHVLPLTVAHFKTPTVRDLGQSFPYLHNGSIDSLEDLLDFYMRVSDLARAGRLRNGSKELTRVRITTADRGPLAAFLRSLNEDYR